MLITVVLLVPLAISFALAQFTLSMAQFALTMAIYLCSLSLSITVYRLSPFHPLAKYPGPVLARISRLWAVYSVIRGKQHMDSHELFLRYGDVVRTGPNHLIMRNASAIPAIHGLNDRWPRHASKSWAILDDNPHIHLRIGYQVHVPYATQGSVIEIIEPADHSKRRRIWDRAFTPRAIKSYEPMLQARVSQLVAVLASRAGQPMDLAEWFGHFALDFMGDFAFGGMFDLMAQGTDSHKIHDSLISFITASEIFGAIPWTRPFFLALSYFKPNQHHHGAARIAEKRKAEGSQVRDLMHYLVGSSVFCLLFHTNESMLAERRRRSTRRGANAQSS